MSKGKFLVFGMALALALASGSAFAGDSDKGQKIFQSKCNMCHSVVQNDKKKKVGPNLFGVVGRKAGTLPSFTKYKGLKGADFVWDDAYLDELLTDSKKFFKKIGGKKSKMVVKTADASKRADVIAHLKTLK